MDEKIPCKKCGALILPATAAQTGGVCMRCKPGMGEALFDDLLRCLKSIWVYVFQKSPRSVVGYALKGALLACATFVMLSIATIVWVRLSPRPPDFGNVAFLFLYFSAVPAGVVLQHLLGGWSGDSLLLFCGVTTWLTGGIIVGTVYGFKMKKRGWKIAEPDATRYNHRDY